MNCLIAALGLGPLVLVSGVGLVLAIDAPPHDISERRPGGAATSKSSAMNRNAFSQSSGNLNFEEQLSFKLGNAIFRKLWVSSPASTKSSDGLGPLYNARSCQRCHLKDGRGHPPKANWPKDNAVSMLMRLSIPPRNDEQRRLLRSGRVNSIPSTVYGGQLQDFAVQGHDGEGKIEVRYRPKIVRLSDGQIVRLREPTYSLAHVKYGPPEPDLMMSPRVAPQMIGLGLLEAVPVETVLRFEDANDQDKDGISGRANRVWSTESNQMEFGRFGWKAGVATLRQQAADAFSGDIGISSPLRPLGFGDCTLTQRDCRNAPHGAGTGYEIGTELLDLVTFYTRHLAVPQRRSYRSTQVLRGRNLFYESGCAACHRPRMQTSSSANDPKLRNQVIWPYTDLLLHDMGPGLNDGRPEGRASGREWRTPPLWGIGLTKNVNGHTFFLHDGRARNVQEAILWHGGEARWSRDSFAKLSRGEREALVAFVNSL